MIEMAADFQRNLPAPLAMVEPAVCWPRTNAGPASRLSANHHDPNLMELPGKIGYSNTKHHKLERGRSMAKDPREVHDSDIERCRAGDEQAAQKVFNRYVDQLVQLARQRISQRIAPRVDAEDVVQSVFRTFFQHVRAGDFTLHDQEDVCKLLVRITIHKALRQIAHHRRAKRDARMETATGDLSQDQLMTVLAEEPTPDEAVIFLDQMETFLEQLSPTDRRICEMRMEGYNNTEIAKILSISDRRIRRLMERLRGLTRREDWQD
jgi:RNA polymerase sigma-70 factor (ECF subfamily)